ncbi:MAG: Brp/Blh family beta-carotene 15,15'-dioxygenase [Bacteroidota bacterium]
MKFKFQIVATVTLLTLYLIFQSHLESIQYTLCAIAILTFGIPHGAIDHILHQKFTKQENPSNTKKFIIWYVLCMLAYLAIWIFLPFKALLLFIALGVYHFGQEFMEELRVERHSKLSFLLWGGTILLMPMLHNYSDTASYIQNFVGGSLPEFSSKTTTLVALFIPLVSILYFSLLFWKKELARSKFIQITVHLVAWTVIYWSVPFIVGFTLYFVLFHSINSMEHQYTSLTRLSSRYNLKQYIKDLSILTLVSYAGIIFLFLLFDLSNWQHITLYMLVFISVLTLPHMLVFEEFYENRFS